MTLLRYFCTPEKNMKHTHNVSAYVLRLFAFFVMIAVSPLHILAQEETDTAEAIHTDTAKTSRVNLHFQTTYIYQYKPAFHALYSGQNSLQSGEDKENSITA